VPAYKRNAIQNITTLALKNSNVQTVTARDPNRAATRVYAGTNSVSANGTAA
jgi:hypothetical protein